MKMRLSISLAIHLFAVGFLVDLPALAPAQATSPGSPGKSSRIRVDLPPGWQSRVPSLRSIVQYAVDLTDAAGFELIVERKSDFAKDVDLMAWAKLVKANTANHSKLANRKDTEPRSRKVSGRETVEFEITGETKLVKLHYRIIMLQLGDSFCRLVCWTNPSHWEADQPKFDELVQRLKIETDQNASLKDSVKAKAEEVNNALMRHDFGKVVDMSHPKVIEMGGGRDKTISMMEARSQDMKSRGVVIRSATVGEPSDPVKSGAELFIVVPFRLEMTFPGGKAFQDSFVIGDSVDQGKTWVFVDGTGDTKTIKQILPNLPEQLYLPAQQRPILEKTGAKQPPTQPAPTENDIKQLQGKWRSVSAMLSGKAITKKVQFTIVDDKIIYNSTTVQHFTLDSTTTPKHLDLVKTVGQKEEMTIPCIFDIKG
jgi:uncharacterized protein (TIGR03067 family)